MNAVAYGVGMLRDASRLADFACRPPPSGTASPPTPKIPSPPAVKASRRVILMVSFPCVVPGPCRPGHGSTVPMGSQHIVKRDVKRPVDASSANDVTWNGRRDARGPGRTVAGGATRSSRSGPGRGQPVTLMVPMAWPPWADTAVTLVAAGAVLGSGPVPV